MNEIPLRHLEKQHRNVLRAQSISRAFGVDLDRLAAANVVPRELHETLTARCMACLHPEACDCWLSRNGVGADAVPHFCRNSEVLRGIFTSHGEHKSQSARPIAKNADEDDEESLEALIHNVCSDAA